MFQNPLKGWSQRNNWTRVLCCLTCYVRRTCWRWPPSQASRLALRWPCENRPRRADRPSGPTSRCRTQSLPAMSFTANHNRTLISCYTVIRYCRGQTRGPCGSNRLCRLKASVTLLSVGREMKGIQTSPVVKVDYEWPLIVCSDLFQSQWWHIVPPASHSAFPYLCSRLLWTGPSLCPGRCGTESSGDACSCSHRQNNFHIHFPPVG